MSNAKCAKDLAGPFKEVGGSLPGVTASVFWGDSPDGLVVGVNIGPAIGAGGKYSGGGGLTGTTVEQEQLQDANGGGVTGGAQGGDTTGDASFYGGQSRCREVAPGVYTCH